MVHPGCGADIIRQRRRNDKLKKEQDMKLLLVQSTLEPFEPVYRRIEQARPKNKRYHGHYTPARDSQVFNKQKCSSLRLTAIQSDNAGSTVRATKVQTKKLSRRNSVVVNNARVLKNQEGYRSKSLEQELPPNCSSIHYDPTFVIDNQSINTASVNRTISTSISHSSQLSPEISSEKSCDTSMVKLVCSSNYFFFRRLAKGLHLEHGPYL